MYGLYGQPFYFRVVYKIGCNGCSQQCGNVPRNQYYTVMNKTTPMYYFYQIPDKFVKIGTNRYLYADSAMMENNFINFWSRDIDREYEKNQAKEELRSLFKEMLEMASKATENMNPQLSIIFDAAGFVMADDFAEALRKAYGIYKKYIQLGNKSNHVKCYSNYPMC